MFGNADLDKARAARLDCTFANRDLFSVGEIASWLAREPGRARIDKNERAQAARDLADAIIRKEFDLSGESEIVTLTSEPPYFRPFGPDVLQEFAILIRRNYPADGLEVFLRRDACRRYLKTRPLGPRRNCYMRGFLRRVILKRRHPIGNRLNGTPPRPCPAQPFMSCGRHPSAKFRRRSQQQHMTEPVRLPRSRRT
jgi:hypothetical protein